KRAADPRIPSWVRPFCSDFAVWVMLRASLNDEARDLAAKTSAAFLAMNSRLDALDDGRDALTAADAHRDERRRFVAALEFVERRAEQHRARRAERMAESDRAAVDVHAFGIDVERADRLQNHGGERFVDLPEIDVARLHAGHLERSLARGRGTGEH